MKNSLVLFIMFLIALSTPILVIEYSEIYDLSYTSLKYQLEEYPELKPYTIHAMKDGKITFGELREIRSRIPPKKTGKENLEESL